MKFPKADLALKQPLDSLLGDYEFVLSEGFLCTRIHSGLLGVVAEIEALKYDHSDSYPIFMIRVSDDYYIGEIMHLVQHILCETDEFIEVVIANRDFEKIATYSN